jgi:hypothetical protein
MLGTIERYTIERFDTIERYTIERYWVTIVVSRRVDTVASEG